jgi:phage FluMu protein Com
MDDHRCPKCNKLLMAMTDRTGRTELRCLKCDQVDPMKTHAAKWADSPLAGRRKRPRATCFESLHSLISTPPRQNTEPTTTSALGS